MAADSLRTWPLAEWLSVGSALEPIELFQAGSGQPAHATLVTKPIDLERRTCVAWFCQIAGRRHEPSEAFPPRRPRCGLHLRDQ